jgi:spermidine synthase
MIRNKILFYACLMAFSTMALEILASRILAPFVGTSIIVWSNIIGVILIAISLGYWWGGKLSLHINKPEQLFKIGIFAGFAVALLPLLTKVLLLSKTVNFIPSGYYEVIVSFIAGGFGFGIPVLIFSLTSPIAIKLLSSDSSSTGSEVGKLYSLTTIFSLFGIYLTTFVLVPVVGLSESLILIAVLLIIINSIFIAKKVSINTFFILLLSFSLILSSTRVSAYSQNKILYQTESLYQGISILQDKNDKRYLVFDRPEYTQSIYNPKISTFGLYQEYYPYYLYNEDLKIKKDINILILGYSGGYIGKLFHKFKPANTNIQIDGVEIDPKVVEISKKYFGVTDDERDIYIEDARTFTKNGTKKYDIIVADLYNKDIFIPSHLITMEFFSEIKNMTTETGVLLLNVNSKTADSEFLNKIHSTMRHSYNFTNQKPTQNYNFLVVGGNKQPKFELSKETLDTFPPFTRNYVSDEFVKTPNINLQKYFSDNKNDSELLISKEFILSK